MVWHGNLFCPARYDASGVEAKILMLRYEDTLVDVLFDQSGP